MKKVIAGIAIVSLLALGVAAYAHGPGGWGGGHMMGPGYGGQMMGPGYSGQMMGPGFGGHMMRGWGGPAYGTDQKFLEETTDLRRDLHNKKFEYFEATRNPETTNETITALEKEIYEIQDKIRDKAPRGAFGGFGGYGRCW